MSMDPATKYADRVDPEYRMAMNMVLGAYHTMSLVAAPLRKLDQAERDAHSFGHIVDPTLYKDMIYSPSFAEQMKIVRAALAFIKACDDVKIEAAARMEKANG
jgi:hypothetical protein